MSNQKKSEEIVIPKDIGTVVFEDPRTHAKTVAFPFVFPDGIGGFLMVLRKSAYAWNPSEDIKSIIVNFVEKV